MKIPVAHVSIQTQNCIVFDADAVDRSNVGRARLLAELADKARSAGLAVDKRALRFREYGVVKFFGDADLVGYLRNNGWSLRTTHTLDV